MTGLLGWLKGKKTIIAGGVVCLFAAMAVFYGLTSVEQGGVIFGFGLAIAGWADKANRHQAEILAALSEVAKIGADIKAGQPVAGELKAAVAASQDVLKDLKPMAAPLAADLGAMAASKGVQLHISADSAEELVSGLTTMTKGLKG